MKWPWQNRPPAQRLVMSWTRGEVAYVQARAQGAGWAITQLGVARQGPDSEADFHQRLQALGLQDPQAVVMLRPDQYQLVQMEAPPVADDELRQAARWQLAGMVEQPLERLVIDVLPLGDAQARKSKSLFVVAVDQDVIDDSLSLAAKLGAEVAVIDVQDCAQRNLQLQALAHEANVSSQALAEASAELSPDALGATSSSSSSPSTQAQAHMAVTLLDDDQALLTITAQGELQYSRRLGVHAQALDAWPADEAPSPAQRQARVPLWAAEIQRSLDVWDRTAPLLPVARISVYAGAQTEAWARGLGQYLGLAVDPLLPLAPVFEGLSSSALAEHHACWPLLGALLRPGVAA